MRPLTYLLQCILNTIVSVIDSLKHDRVEEATIVLEQLEKKIRESAKLSEE